MGTQRIVIEFADLATLLHGGNVAIGGISIVLNAAQLDTALAAMSGLGGKDIDADTGAAALRDAGIDINIRTADDHGP